MTKFNQYFCGNKISEYGRKEGFVDYQTFASAFDAVLNNDLMQELEKKGFCFEWVVGCPEDDDEEYFEIFQYFVVSDEGANLIRDYKVGYLFYCEELDLYIWGVCHWGTAWDYVLTDIPCEKESKNN